MSTEPRPDGLPTGVNATKTDPEELLRLRDRIIAGARAKVDPHDVGFRPVMDTTDDSSFFRTDDAVMDWWEWVEQTIHTLSDGLTRLSLGLTSGAFAIASAQMLTSEAGRTYAPFTLGVSGVLAAWLVVSTVRASAIKR